MLMDAYCTSLNERINDCEQALRDKNNTQLHEAAHDIKSISMAIGATDLGNIAALIEKNVKDGNPDAAFSDTGNMIDLMKNLKNIIEEFLNHNI